MKKNVVWWPAIVHEENAHKYGNYDYFEYTRDEFPHIDELSEHLSAQDIGYFSIYYRSVDENIYASKISKVFS